MRRLASMGLLALLTLIPAVTEDAEAAGFVVEVAGGADVPLALPRPHVPSGDPGVSKEVWEVVWRDLELSGYFKMIDEDAYIEQGKGVEPGEFGFDDWKTINTAVLAKTRILPGSECGGGEGRVCVDLFVYYVIGGDKLVSKRFRSASDNARHLGHAAANAIIESISGQPGFFGTRIAAVGEQGGNKEVYLMDVDGRRVAKATRNGSINLSPAWSPDGHSLAWTSYKRGNPDVYVKDLSSGRTRVLSNLRGINASPSFSPDGSRVALARSRDGDSDVFVIDSRSGKTLNQVTKGGGIDVSPDFSPDGTSVVYASERSGGSQIYVQDLASGQSTRVSFEGGFNTDPVFSPDGSQIAYVTRTGGGFDIIVVDSDGRNPVRITQDMRDNEDPAWSPDGRYLLFSSTRTGRSELWISTADGRHQMRITKSGGWTQPAWAP